MATTRQPSSISIHAPTRGATASTTSVRPIIPFQSTLPREERHIAFRCFPFTYYFNPRSHERSDSFSSAILSLCTNFNPRSHERSDSYMICLPYYDIISIHAPTRGATLHMAYQLFRPVFQSTLPREERREKTGIHQRILRFQSTLPREERRVLKSVFIFSE